MTTAQSIIANSGDISAASAIEVTPGVLAGDQSGMSVADNVWYQQEVNNLTRAGTRFTLGTIDVITSDRQNEPGSPQSADTQVQFRTYNNMDILGYFIEALLYATGKGADAVNLSATGVTANAITGLAALNAGQASQFPDNGLVALTGSGAGNNGLHAVGAAASNAGTSITISGGNVESGNANLRVSKCGLRAAANTSGLAWDYDAATGEAELTWTGHGAEAAGLTEGQMVFIGSKDPATNMPRNALNFGTANDGYGKAFVKSIDTNSIVFHKMDDILKDDDSAIPTVLDILFSDYYRNVNTRSLEFLRRTFQFELDFLVGATSIFRYIRACRLNSGNIAFPDAQFSTVDWSLIGTASESNVQAANRKSVADMYQDATYRQPNNSGRGIAKVLLEIEGLTGDLIDFVSGNINITNNLGGANRLGTFGQAFASEGIFQVQCPLTAYFTDDGVSEAVEQNRNASLIIVNSTTDGLVAHRIPEGKLEHNGLNIQTGRPIQQNIQLNAHRSQALEVSYTCSMIRTDLTGIAGQA